MEKFSELEVDRPTEQSEQTNKKQIDRVWKMYFRDEEMPRERSRTERKLREVASRKFPRGTVIQWTNPYSRKQYTGRVNLYRPDGVTIVGSTLMNEVLQKGKRNPSELKILNLLEWAEVIQEAPEDITDRRQTVRSRIINNLYNAMPVDYDELVRVVDSNLEGLEGEPDVDLLVAQIRARLRGEVRRSPTPWQAQMGRSR